MNNLMIRAAIRVMDALVPHLKDGMLQEGPEERKKMRETLRKYREAVIRYEGRRTREALGRDQKDADEA